MDIRFDEKRVLVTGAGKGIGRAIAKALVEGGAVTYALTRTQSDLDSLKNECPTIHTVCVDVEDWDATRKAVQDVGPIDLLVNNAGLITLEPFIEVKPESFDKVINVNLKAVFNISQVVAKDMIERGKGGSIVNISSMASKVALPERAVYAASKGGLDMLTKVMALELGPHQIRVNAVNPTIVMTAMGKLGWGDPAKGDPAKNRIPLHKFAEECDIVRPVLYLLSDKSDMINGVTLLVDGGFTIC